MHSVIVLEQFAFWQSLPWYNAKEPVLSVEWNEGEKRWVANNEEVPLELTMYQHRVPAWNENLLLLLSDALLRAIQHWLTRKNLPLTTRCVLSLQEKETNPLPLTRCLGMMTNTPIMAFFPWTVPLSQTLTAKLDGLSFNWLLAKCLSPSHDVKLVMTVRYNHELPEHDLLTS